MNLTDILDNLLVPVVTAVVGAVGILIRDLYDRRSEMGRRKYVMDDATRQVTFAAEWWKAKQRSVPLPMTRLHARSQSLGWRRRLPSSPRRCTRLAGLSLIVRWRAGSCLRTHSSAGQPAS
jgi:hypothetical protein